MSGRRIHRVQGIRHSGEVVVAFDGKVTEEAGPNTCTVVVGQLKVYFGRIDEIGESMRKQVNRMGSYIFNNRVKMYLPLDACDMLEFEGPQPQYGNPLRLEDSDVHHIVVEAFGDMAKEAQLNPRREKKVDAAGKPYTYVRPLKKKKTKKQVISVRSLVAKALK